MTLGAIEALQAAKALICKERRDSFADSFVDAPNSKSWNEGPPQTPVLEEMDWLAGPEGMEWLSNLRVSAEAPPATRGSSYVRSRSNGVDDFYNDENQSLGANVDRRQAMNMATNGLKGLKALPAKPLQPLPPNTFMATPRSMTMPESPAKQRFAMYPSQSHCSRSSSFTVARVRHPSRSASFDNSLAVPAGLLPNQSFNCRQPVQASVPLQSISSFDRPVCVDSSSFQHGPPSRPVRSPGSFALGPPVGLTAPRALSRGPAPPTQSRPAPPTQSRSVSRGAPDDRHIAGSTRRTASARHAPANVGMQLYRDVSVEKAGAGDMPELATEDIARPTVSRACNMAMTQRPASQRKKGSIFWKPPPEAAEICAAMKIPSFVAPEVENRGRKPPVAPVVGMPPPAWATQGFTSQSASFVPPAHQSRPPSFPSSSFVPPPRSHSNSFAPSPRQM